MHFTMLGPLEVRVGEREVPLGGARQRAVLAILLLHRREVVSADRIADELWGERPPETSIKTVRVYVSRLRKLLGEEVLVSRGGGYSLVVGPEDVDVDRFERLIVAGREASERGDAEAAAATFTNGLELWRGPPLADFAYDEFASAEIARLEELRLGVQEDRIDSELALGHHAAAIPELERLIGDHPTRERLRGLLMLALYRAGRQADALEVYRDTRRTLQRELGLEPGPELQRLEREILAQDPGLDAPARPRRAAVAADRRRAAPFILAGGGLLLAAAVVAAIGLGGDSSDERAPANSVAVIDPASNELVTAVPTGVTPTAVSGGEGSVWVANTGDDSITQVDPSDRTVVSTTAPRTDVAGLAAGDGAVWIANNRGAELIRFDPSLQSSRSIRFATRLDPFDQYPTSPVALGHGSVWALASGDRIFRVDTQSNRVMARISVGNGPSGIATGQGAVWVTDDTDNTLSRIDPAGNVVTATTPVGQGPSAVAAGEGAVWVANTDDGTVIRVDPQTAVATHTIEVGGRPIGIATGEGAVWVANSLDGTVSRIDPAENHVEVTVDVGEAPEDVTVSDGLVWTTVRAAAAPDSSSTAVSGEGAEILYPGDPGPTDPAFGVYPIGYLTCAKLYNYPDRPFPEGARLRPEVAVGPPTVSADGRTYTFELRDDYHFSPPSNEQVTAAAYERAFERVMSPKMDAYGSGLLTEAIVGAQEYENGEATRIRGVSARGQTLVIRLTEPVPNLPSRLGADYFCAVPPEAPIDPEGIDDLPSAGPYHVVSRDPEKSLVLRPNPNYTGPRPHELAEIRFDFAADAEEGVGQVEAGEADYVALATELEQPVPPGTRRRLEQLYGPASEAARAGRQQLFTEPLPVVLSYIFNSTRGPFADPRLRRAVNYAIDRRALAASPGLGPPEARPTDQYIPPGMPGFEDATIYPLGAPDPVTARRLAGDVKRHAVLYTCDTPGCTRNGETLRKNLRVIGIELDVRSFPIGEMFRRQFQPNPQWDIGSWGWLVDYADPFDYINNQFAAGVEHPGGFYDPAFEARMEEAAKLAGEERLREYARLDRELAEQAAPQATFASGEMTYLLSARMGCQVSHPVYGLDFAALCIRDEDEE